MGSIEMKILIKGAGDLATGIASRLYYKNDDSQNRLLTGIINSYGVITKAGYQQLNDL